ncbi:MAG: GntR family transcriptional regulator [Tissierellia bacterium]|nr:GntR family transcriptional regulator [Tissierellia bacterium]
MINTKIKISGKEKAYRTLRAMISSGELKPNDRIIESRIAEILNLSRTPVREAIAQLEREGMITKIKDKGAVVNKLSLKRIFEFYELKIKLEDLAIDYFFRTKTEKHYKELTTSMELISGHYKMDRIERTSAEMEKWRNIVLYATGNKPLIMILKQVYSNLLTFNSDLSKNRNYLTWKVEAYKRLTEYFVNNKIEEFKELNERINGEELKFIMDSIDYENF